MGALMEYYQVTKEAIEVLGDVSWERDRENAISRLDEIIGIRERLQKDIQPPFTDEEKQLGELCVKLNEELTALMAKRRMEVAQDIKLVREQKQHNQKYANPYEAMLTDGVYYDKRK